MSSAKTGEYSIILEWFKENPNVWLTPVELANEMQIDQTKARNAIAVGLRRNFLARERIVIKGHGTSRYKLRGITEKREEFKIARPSVTPRNNADYGKSAYPVLTEINPKRASDELLAHLPKKAGDRIQFLNTSTAIIWNSSKQCKSMRSLALGKALEWAMDDSIA